MKKKEVRREDGRYLIYYSFEDEETISSEDADRAESPDGTPVEAPPQLPDCD